MSSGIVLPELHEVVSSRSSKELHVIDMFFKRQRTGEGGYMKAYSFDDLVRVVCAASNADSVEASAFSDVLRCYLLSNVIPANKGAPVAVDSPKTPAGDTINDSKDGDDEGEEVSDSVEEAVVEKEVYILDAGLLTIAYKVITANILAFVDDILLTFERPEDPETRSTLEDVLFARLAAVRYAAHLATNERAVAPSDNEYEINGVRVKVPRDSKVAREVLRSFGNGVVVTSHGTQHEYRLEPSARTRKYYTAVRDALEKILNEMTNGKDPTIYLTHGFETIFKEPLTLFQQIQQSRVGRLLKTIKDTVAEPLTEAEVEAARVAEEKAKTPVEWIDVSKMIHTNLPYTSNVVDMFIDAPKSVDKPIEINTGATDYDTMVNDITAPPDDPDLATERRDAFFQKLLRGEFCKRSLAQKTSYKDDLKKKKKKMNPSENEEGFKSKRIAIDGVPKIPNQQEFFVGADRPLCECKFARVDNIIDTVFPSILAPFYPVYESLQDNFGSFSGRQFSRSDVTGADIEENRLINAYIDYVAETYATDTLTKEAIKRGLNDEYEAIFGGAPEYVFDQRAARVAFQWDTIYFHMVQKYRHGNLKEADKQDWLCFMEVDSSKGNHPMRAGGTAYAYSAKSGTITVDTTVSSGSTAHERSRIDLDYFNAVLLRDRIMSAAAKELFPNPIRGNPPKIWLTSLPDVYTPLGPSTPKIQEKGFFSRILNYVWRGSVAETTTASEAFDMGMTKAYGTVRAALGLEKYVSIVSFAERTQTPKGASVIRRQHVLFHQKAKTPKEVGTYLNVLTVSKKKTATSPPLAAPITAPNDEPEFEQLLNSEDEVDFD